MDDHSDTSNAAEAEPWTAFSGIVADDDADTLFDQLPDDLLARFAEQLDQAEADLVWAAASANDAAWFRGADWLLSRTLRFGCTSSKRGWGAFNAALIRFSTRRYLDWCGEQVDAIAGGQDGGDRIALLEFVLPLVLYTAPAEEAVALTRRITALPSMGTRMSLLNLVAASAPPAGTEHPVLTLARSADRSLMAGIRDCWESCFRSADKNPAAHWRDYVGTLYPARFPSVTLLIGEHFPGLVELEFGYSAGIRADTLQDVERKLGQLGARHHADILAPMARLWFILHQMNQIARASRGKDTEMVGLRIALKVQAEQDPGRWARALTWILLHADSIKNEVISVTVQMGTAHPEVRDALRALHDTPELSILATGILALIDGVAHPGDQHTLALADSLAHYFDGTPKFPSPLALRSATWLGSGRLEEYLRNGIARACFQFARHVSDNVGSLEEALTEHLLTEIDVQFRDGQMQAIASRSEAYGVPTLNLKRREISKGSEESDYGCDLAFLVRAEAQAVYQMTWAALVQVKKTLAKPGTSSADSWEIKVAQLETLLKTCASAAYFLICGSGEVLVVPARHLLGFVQGKAQAGPAKSRTLGYNDVRSAAIPLEQYMVDLLVGQWTGSEAEATLAFVNSNAAMQPRHVVELDIAFAPRAKG